MPLNKHLIFLGFLFVGVSAKCQLPELTPEGKEHYQKISRSAVKVSPENSQTVYHLSETLTRNCNTDLEKARAIFAWITNNITYDMVSFKAGEYPDYHARAVLKSKLALCEGYARLFQALAIEAGLKSEIIRGYSKGYGYQPGDEFDVINHSWNAVEIDGQWYLLDATWAATSKNDTKIKQPVNEKYFLSEPELFLVDHLPEIPLWQLVDNPISLAEFEAGLNSIQSRLQEAVTFNYKDSLAQFLALDASTRKIEYQKRASIFNPKNTSADYHIGVEYLYRGLDSLERIHDMSEVEIESGVDELETQVFNLLSEAAFHFTGLKPSSPYFESAQNFLDETIYERGVFKYEVAHRLIEIYNTFDAGTKAAKFDEYQKRVDKYFAEAKSYFAQIPFDSWYYEHAYSYLNYHLTKEFAEL